MPCQNHIQPFSKIKKALSHDAITVLWGTAKRKNKFDYVKNVVLLRAVSLPCHQNVQPYIMVTRCHLRAEGFLLHHFSKSEGRNSTQYNWQNWRQAWGRLEAGVVHIWRRKRGLTHRWYLVGLPGFCVGGCLRDPLATDSPKPRFYLLFQLSQCCDIINFTVRLVESQA